tara:strand:- start:167 stop:424 length:258 start_codon:yes stop_codon:yes gene_type:complete
MSDKNKRKIDWDQFVRGWQSSESCSDVLKKLDLEDTKSNRAYISVKAGYARKKGVNLKKFVRTQSSNDWARLAELAESIEHENGK